MEKLFSGDALLYQIAKSGMNRAQTAEKAGIHRNTVSYLTSGKCKHPAKLTLLKLAIVLNCSPNDFFIDDETDKEK